MTGVNAGKSSASIILTVVAIAAAAHAARDAPCLEDHLVVLARVRTALIRVVEQPGIGAPALQCPFERLDRQVPVVDRTDGPADYESRVQVEDRGQV